MTKKYLRLKREVLFKDSNHYASSGSGSGSGFRLVSDILLTGTNWSGMIFLKLWLI